MSFLPLDPLDTSLYSLIVLTFDEFDDFVNFMDKLLMSSTLDFAIVVDLTVRVVRTSTYY